MYLGLRDNSGPWTLRDRALAEGLSAYQAGRNQYGIPYSEAFDGENNGAFTVTPRIDQSIAAIEQWRIDYPDQAKERGLVLMVSLETDNTVIEVE